MIEIILTYCGNQFHDICKSNYHAYILNLFRVVYVLYFNKTKKLKLKNATLLKIIKQNLTLFL